MEQPLKLKRNREDQLVLTYQDTLKAIIVESQIIKSLGARKPKGLNMITNTVYGHLSFHIFLMSFGRCRDRMVVGFTTT